MSFRYAHGLFGWTALFTNSEGGVVVVSGTLPVRDLGCWATPGGGLHGRFFNERRSGGDGLLFSHEDGEEQAARILGVDCMVYWLLLDRDLEPGLEGTERFEISSVCEEFSGRKLNILMSTVATLAGVVILLGEPLWLSSSRYGFGENL
jgi:hypothetical protein